jgi:hypothetical protein
MVDSFSQRTWCLSKSRLKGLTAAEPDLGVPPRMVVPGSMRVGFLS